jgi:carboxylesterase type B
MFPKFYQVVSWLLHCHLVLALSIHSETDIRNSASKGPVVTNGIATYVGLSNSTYNVDAWLGIPYAKAPIGKLRLQPPQPIKNEGIVNSQERGYACFQMASPTSFVTSYAQSEDCLTINIFKPSEVASKRTLPVLFWIHGGAFNSGSGIKYDAKSMANRSAELNNPAIIITINYRLSFFGFSGKSLSSNVHCPKSKFWS